MHRSNGSSELTTSPTKMHAAITAKHVRAAAVFLNDDLAAWARLDLHGNRRGRLRKKALLKGTFLVTSRWPMWSLRALWAPFHAATAIHDTRICSSASNDPTAIWLWTIA